MLQMKKDLEEEAENEDPTKFTLAKHANINEWSKGISKFQT
jgi:hypothetical protein